jgi:catechol 2,3-dioxygenase-like lactoylglutathione lyase family enzyme
MRLHHMCLITADLEQSIKFWRDIMGFTLKVKAELPDGESPDSLCTPKLLDDSFGIRGARSKMAILTSENDGSFIELQQPQNPNVQLTPPENLRYAHTGVHELGLVVENIDEMFEKVRAAGLRTNTDYIWSTAHRSVVPGEVPPPDGRSFIFSDYEGNMIQLWQYINRSPA